MIALTLTGSWEQQAAPGEEIGGQRLLLHQALTRQATAPLVMNAYPTGTGKTQAALLRLRQRALEEREPPNCLFIAPTNELLAQHVETVRRFAEQHLPTYRVEGIDRETRDALALPEGLERAGAKLHAILSDLRLVTGEDRQHPFVFVVNPDIFYYAFYCRYGRQDQRNLFRDVLLRFDQVVIDEFHYYNPKQVANFLFFFQVCESWGYFDNGKRQIVLLSATPGPFLNTYLDRLGVEVQRIAPTTTQPGANAVPALAPVQLELYGTDEVKGGLSDLVAARRNEIVGWVRSGQQGAIISGALWRINHCYDLLRATLGDQTLRLTGAESREGRSAARHADLILATPTVDIGYNFERREKPRQSLDFLLFDARSSDDVVQRLGRAGRVLGKPEVTQPSRVLAIVPQELYRALAGHAGQTLDRQTFAHLVTEALPATYNVDAYISRGAIVEAMLPLYKLQKMGESDDTSEVERLFEDVRALYAPTSKRTFKGLLQEMRTFECRQQVFGSGQSEKEVPLGYAAHYLVKKLRNDGHGTIDETTMRAALSREDWRAREGVREIEQQWRQERAHYAVQRARFSFREAFEPPQALVYDPKHLLSSADVVRYDALHVVANVHLVIFPDLVAWSRETGQTVGREQGMQRAAIYCVAKELRTGDERLRLSLVLDVAELPGEWEPLYCCEETAFRGLRLTAGGAALSTEICRALVDQDVVAFVVPMEQNRALGKLLNLCRTEGYHPYNLHVRFGDGNERDYVALLGTAALLGGAALFPTLQAIKGQPGASGGAIIC